MKRVLLILAMILLGEYTFSQQYLNKVFDIPYDNAIHTILPTDSGYILGLHGAMGVCLVDSQANIKWLKTYYDQTGIWASYTGGANPNVLANTNHNTYIAGGTMQNGGPSANKVFAVKYSGTFDTLYVKLLLQDTITLTNYINNSFIGDNGNYIFMGHSGNSGLIIRTDTNCNFIDSILIKKGSDGSWLNAGLQMGNYYYFFGGTYSYAPSLVAGFDREDGWAVKTDLQGNEIISQHYGNTNLYDQEFQCAIKIPGNKILIGHFYSYDTNSEGFLMGKPWTLILDSNLDIYKEIYLKNASVSGDTLFSMGNTQAILNSDSSVSILGVKSAYNMNQYKIEWGKGMLTRMDKNFKIKFSREYIHNASQYINIFPLTIATTSDDGYLIGGYITDNNLTPSEQSWLVKTDSLGCDGFHSCDDTTLVCQILNAPDTACKNDTAWLQVRLKGRSAPYFIYANNSLALDSVYYPYTLPLWIDTLIPFKPTVIGMQQVIIKVQDPWGWNRSDTVQIYVKNCGADVLEEAWYPKKVEIYPNPATNELHVKIRSTITNPVSLTIYNMQGKVVKQITTKQNETVIDVSGLEQGVYGIRVVGDKINIGERFVKL